MRIVLHEPLRSDAATMEALSDKENTADVVHVAIGDPMEAIKAQVRQRSATYQPPALRLRMLGSLINRIASGRCSIFVAATRSKEGAQRNVRSGERGLIPSTQREAIPRFVAGYSAAGTTTRTVLSTSLSGI